MGVYGRCDLGPVLWRGRKGGGWGGRARWERADRLAEPGHATSRREDSTVEGGLCLCVYPCVLASSSSVCSGDATSCLGEGKEANKNPKAHAPPTHPTTHTQHTGRWSVAPCLDTSASGFCCSVVARLAFFPTPSPPPSSSKHFFHEHSNPTTLHKPSQHRAHTTSTTTMPPRGLLPGCLLLLLVSCLLLTAQAQVSLGEGKRGVWEAPRPRRAVCPWTCHSLASFPSLLCTLNSGA